ncbi:MAG: hypothetical protein INQ03_06140 [Candidatus Heimdallarchaeota archaeon]|nr:hypothetical protein [Candidatus Heimdallarchaeota archaeon]
MIYRYEYKQSELCGNCQMGNIVPLTSVSKIRYSCNYCNVHYFFTKYYVDDTQEINEYIQSFEKTCDECRGKVVIDKDTKELVCLSCGLVFEHPIMMN